MIKINLGCGREYREGWKNIDISRDVKTDIIADIRIDTLPFKDNQVTEIYCSGVLEQILLNEHLVFALNECHRVLQPLGHITIIVPNAKFITAFQDPHDVRQFSDRTFNYFDMREREYDLYGSVYGYQPWHIVSKETNPRGIMTVVLQKQ